MLLAAEVLRVFETARRRCRAQALQAQRSEASAARRQLELALQQAHFEAPMHRRQYDAVDPANRLVAGELERRWNEALQERAPDRSEAYRGAGGEETGAIDGEQERQRLMQLRRGSRPGLALSGRDYRDAQEDRLRAGSRNEIVVRLDGGFSRNDSPALARRGPHRAEALKTNGAAPTFAGRHPRDTLPLIRGLARHKCPDRQIARLLNRAGKPTGRGNAWTEPRVRSFRRHHGIAVYRDGRMGRARRVDARSSGANHRSHCDVGAAHDSTRRHQGETAL